MALGLTRDVGFHCPSRVRSYVGVQWELPGAVERETGAILSLSGCGRGILTPPCRGAMGIARGCGAEREGSRARLASFRVIALVPLKGSGCESEDDKRDREQEASRDRRNHPGQQKDRQDDAHDQEYQEGRRFVPEELPRCGAARRPCSRLEYDSVRAAI